MIKQINFRVICALIILTVSSNLNAQVFSQFDAFKELIEYEGQRFLMDDILHLTETEIDELRIEKTIKEVDSKEGFMFVLTSYVFNGKSGVIITSFNSTSFQNDRYSFRNVHLLHKDFETLHNTFFELKSQNPKYNEHYLRRFNDRLIVDVTFENASTQFILWVDDLSRHTFSVSKWERAFRKYEKFIN